MARLGVVLALVVLTGCAGPRQRREPGFVLDRGSDATTPAWLGNAAIGVRFRADGSGVPGRAFFERVREVGGEERLLPCENPFAVEVLFNGRIERSPSPEQTLDLRSSVLATQWSTKNVAVEVEAVVHPILEQASVRWRVRARRHGRVEFGRIGGRPETPSWAGSAPEVVAAPGTVRQWAEEGEERRDFGLCWGTKPSSQAHDALVAESRRAAQARWRTDIEIDGPVEDQDAVRAALHYLRSSSGLSPMGLSSNLYGGHTLWDADLWLLPALSLIDPDRAKEIADYRLARLGEARRNAAGQGAPSGSAAYPWESGPSGREVCRTDHRFAAHVSGSVLLGLDFARHLGLAEEGPVKEVGRAVASFYRWRSSSQQGGEETIRRTLGPDESGPVDSDLYTNALVEWCRREYGSEHRVRYFRPRDQTTFLSHAGDDLRSRKQAAALLCGFPLQDRAVEAELPRMLKRFAGRAVRQGPAMSSGIDALLWARSGEPELAYRSWLDATRPYARALGLFNEKANKLEDRTQFATGAACALNAVIYGFLGFRVDAAPQAGAIWSAPLRGNAWISVRPRLPGAWKSVTFRNFRVLGRTYTLTVDHHSAKVDQGVP